ncbi:hypothetical protein ONS96_014772 [Cadophora gregata f. sp. sojae]|nr:hypothetical protein ONS96_014772 [Cadophora gregata f. sp. sojae]
MAAALIDGIGLLSGGLGIIGFIQDNLPGGDLPEGATLRVKVGLEKGDDEGQLNGNLAAVYAWDINNNYLGQGAGQDIAAGDAPTITVDQSSPGTRAEFVGLSGGDDAICIAWVTVAQKDETLGGRWTGDVGYSCGENWYEQAEFAGYIDKDGPQTEENKFIPHCSWLDGDHTNDIKSAAMKFRTLAYGEESTNTINNGAGCTATIWGTDTGPINDKPSGKRSLQKARSGLKPRPEWMESRLVVSNITQHSAKDLCTSATSWGPDFVSESEGLFCDMGTKTLLPLCGGQDVDGCVDVDEVEKKVKKRTVVARREVQVDHKTYGKAVVWGR